MILGSMADFCRLASELPPLEVFYELHHGRATRGLEGPWLGGCEIGLGRAGKSVLSGCIWMYLVNSEQNILTSK